jgi:hypothetical protein
MTARGHKRNYQRDRSMSAVPFKAELVAPDASVECHHRTSTTQKKHAAASSPAFGELARELARLEMQ